MCCRVESGSSSRVLCGITSVVIISSVALGVIALIGATSGAGGWVGLIGNQIGSIGGAVLLGCSGAIALYALRALLGQCRHHGSSPQHTSQPLTGASKDPAIA